MLKRLRVQDGVLHSEFRVSERGVRLMEVNGRPPGGNIGTLYKMATGQSLEDAVIAVATGDSAHCPQPRRWAREAYLDHPYGRLESVDIDWPGVSPVWIREGQIMDRVPGDIAASAPAALRALTVGRQHGDVLTVLASNQDRAVSYLIDAATQAELDGIERAVRSGGAHRDPRLRVSGRRWRRHALTMADDTSRGTGRLRSIARAAFPPPGPIRILAAATFVNMVGSGFYLTSSLLFFTRVVGLTTNQVGFGLAVAALTGIACGVPLGHVADRVGPARRTWP